MVHFQANNDYHIWLSVCRTYSANTNDRLNSLRILIVLAIAFCMTSCARPHLQATSETFQNPALHATYMVMDDGYKLPLAVWPPTGAPQAIILAIHGFNDYSNAFSGPGSLFAGKGIKTYAYDQRGFGNTAQRGIWPGVETLLADARTIVRLVCQQHPDTPLYVLGESMGGAVIMNILEDTPCIDGAILVAPAVWGWQTMPFWQRSSLWLTAHAMPKLKVSGKGLDITPSDNTAMLRALGSDPLIIKKTRIDTIFGLTNLMQQAFLVAPQLTKPTLLLYGEKDEIIPPAPVCEMLGALPSPNTKHWRLALYPDGYHMLTRDLQASVVLEDMAAWMNDKSASLPSANEATPNAQRVKSFCNR